MKTKTFIALLISIILMAGSAQEKKIAVISIFFDKNISGTLTEDMINDISKDKNFDFVKLANDFRTKLFEKYLPSLGIVTIDEKSVIGNAEYKMIKSGSKSIWDVRMQTPEGYKFIDSRPLMKDDEIIKKTFAIFPEVSAVMICYVDFNMGTSTGGSVVGANKIMAYANFKILDRNAKNVVTIREYAQSKGFMVNALGGSVYNPEKLAELSNEALEALYRDLDKKLIKNKEKVQKKLSEMK